MSLAAAAPLLLAGCNAARLVCGAAEQRAVTVNTDPALAYTRADALAPAPLQLIARVTEQEAGSGGFAELFAVVDDGASIGRGVMLPLGGRDSTTGESIALTLVLPTPLRAGTTFSVWRAFELPLGDLPRGAMAPRALADPSRAEIAFRTGTYHFPPAEWRTTFLATVASGTVRVRDRHDRGVSLTLDLVVTDAAGRTVRLTGPVGVFAERYTPPCS